MKKKVILLVIFLCTFLFGINVVEADVNPYYCNRKAAEELIKILIHEVGGVVTDDSSEDFFTKVTTSAIIINNTEYWVSKSSYSTFAERIYNLKDGQYAGHSSYKDKSYEENIKNSGVDEGKLVYIAELVLSEKYTLPSNLTFQAAKYILDKFDATYWTYVDFLPQYDDVYFGYNGTLTNKDVFGNTINDNSPEYYRKLSKSLEQSDYSKYTIDNVCNNNISGGNVVVGDSDLPGVNMHPSVVVPTCENPAILKVIYFINLILDIVRIVVPIGLIIMGMMDFSKAVVSSDEGVQKKSVKLLIKRIIIAVLVFVVPWAVEFIMVNLGELTEDVNFTDCIANANSEDIAIYEEKYEELKKEAEEQAKEEAENNGGNSNSGGSTNTKKDYIIYIGDSRTVGMCASVTLGSNENCSIAKGGEGYPWLTSYEVSSKLAKILKDNKNSYIVINMGTNSGLSSNEAHKYAEFYNKLAKQYPKNQVVAVSVTQVDPAKAKAHGMYATVDITTSSVRNFNNAMLSKLNSDVMYCDVYSKIEGSYNTDDGVHYDAATYKKIYNEIKNCLK